MPNASRKKPCLIAICGKGGVGKTSISAAIVKLFLDDPSRRVLAIDADPAMGLAGALGVEVVKTVDDVRSSLIRQVESGDRESRAALVAQLDYEIFESLRERQNLAFLAIGRPEKEGCYCEVNDLLKDIIASVAEAFDCVVIDGEAGIEQVNRRVMSRVTHLIEVSDASARGIRVANTICSVADSAIQYERAGLILNRIRGEKELEALTIPERLNFLGWLPEENLVRDYDLRGQCVLGMPETPFLRALRGCLAGIGLDPTNSPTR